MASGSAVAVYIDCEQNGDTSKHWVSIGPVSQHATATIITGPTFMRKRLCSFTDDFPLNGYTVSTENLWISSWSLVVCILVC